MNGGCFCGSIRYELLSDPEDVYYCHCRDCQILSGSAFHVLGIVKAESMRIVAGEPAQYVHRTDSESQMTREFCSGCGTPLFLRSTRFPEIRMFTVSSLDDPDSVKPSFQVWSSRRLSWSKIDRELKSYVRGALDG